MILPGFPRPLPMAGGLPPEFVAAGPVNRSTGTFITLTLPAHEDGDLLIAIISTGNLRDIDSTPSGWSTDLYDQSTDGTIRVHSKIASSEGATAVFRWTSSSSTTGVIITLRNASALQMGTVNRESAINATALGITPAKAGYLLGTFFAYSNRSPTAAPSGMSTLVSYDGTSPALLIAGVVWPSKSATGNKVSSWDGSSGKLSVLAMVS